MSKAEFCLGFCFGLHTAVVFCMQSFNMSYYPRQFQPVSITLCIKLGSNTPVADPGGTASAAPTGTQFFCFCIHFRRKVAALKVGAPPLTTRRHPLTRNPGSAVAPDLPVEPRTLLFPNAFCFGFDFFSSNSFCKDSRSKKV